jgi:hypothetical protein
VDYSENVSTLIIRVVYGRTHPVEICAARMKTATEFLRWLISTARTQAD